MAFRASKKPATKKTDTKKATKEEKLTVDEAVVAPSVVDMPEASASEAAFSVEDLVGGPKEKSPEFRVPFEAQGKQSLEHAEEKKENIMLQEEKPMPVPPAAAPAPVRTQPYNPPQQNYGSNYGQNRSSGGGYHNRPQQGRYNGDFRRQNNGGGGYRRDMQQGNYNSAGNGNGNGGGFTQDVDVPTETVRGILDVMPEGHGFLRPKFTPSDRDIYISQSQIRRFLLRNGDMVEGQARQPKDNERYWGLLKVEKINDHPADQMEKRPRFEDLTPVYPNTLLRLETEERPLSTRIIDLVAPIGFGQRGLIVSPPKAGKTTIIKELAAGIAANYPDVHLMAALIGERPEEVTDIARSVKGEVLASNFDESPQEQTRIAEVALDRAKRLVEMGKDVVILLDSITRLARAYNLVVNPSGRTLSGGFDPAALYPAKKFLGAARCVEPFAILDGAQGKPFDVKRVTTGGSLTVIGTALVETGSRMDDLIYEEFKGTGNMELHLSRILQERRVFPAIDIAKSGTRHDELLLGEETMKKVTTLRHMLSLLSDEERTMMLIERLTKSKLNSEFLESLAKG